MIEKKEQKNTKRPPVVVIMGHIDHGKSTLLDYIRKSNIVDKEIGGITQKIAAYEVETKEGEKITFIDTPGHEAFSKMRERGAKMADIAILIVSAEDGVKPQTIEAWKDIITTKTPAIVAINKIDKQGANIEKTKTELAENEIYLENYGGQIPSVLISAKTGEGIDNLLSLISILAEMENLEGNKKEGASGYVLEAKMEPKRGIEATLIIKNGTLKKGMVVVVLDSICGVRIMEDFQGRIINEATFSSPVKLIGFDKIPKVGEEFFAFDNKELALNFIKDYLEDYLKNKKEEEDCGDKKIIPIVLKADVSGSLEAIEKEIRKIKDEKAIFKIISKGEGTINENNIKNIASEEDVIVIGFNVKVENHALELAERRKIKIATFNIIYQITDFLKEEMDKRRPKEEMKEIIGKAKILKTFSRTKEKEIVGGKVIEGTIKMNSSLRILRREAEIGQGKIVNLEKNKIKVGNVEKGDEFGMMIETKTELATGDTIEAFLIVYK